MTFPTIKGFIGSHLNCCLIAIVVGELDQGQVLTPRTLKIQDTGTEHVFKCLIGALSLAVSLWMEHRAELQLGSYGLMQTLPKRRSKLSVFETRDTGTLWNLTIS